MGATSLILSVDWEAPYGTRSSRERRRPVTGRRLQSKRSEGTTGEGKLSLAVSTDRAGKFAVTQLIDKANILRGPGALDECRALPSPHNPDPLPWLARNHLPGAGTSPTRRRPSSTSTTTLSTSRVSILAMSWPPTISHVALRPLAASRLRIHQQNLDESAGTIHRQSDPPDAGAYSVSSLT